VKCTSGLLASSPDHFVAVATLEGGCDTLIEMVDIFSILDVTRREDTYTSILVHALRASQPFLEAFIGKTGLRSGLHWRISMRKAVASGRVPDLTLSADDTQGAFRIFLENKIDASEGPNQTEHYLAAVTEEAGDEDRARGIFLTLNGTRGADGVFAWTHREIAELLHAHRSTVSDRALGVAIDCYIARALVPLPVASAQLTLEKLLIPIAHALHPGLAGYTALAHAISNPLTGWQAEALTIQGRGHANPGLKFRRDGWRGPCLVGDEWRACNRDVHVEIEFEAHHPGELKLHFETSPYLPTRAIAKLVNSSEFEQARDRFRHEVHRRRADLPSWTMRRKPILVATSDPDLSATDAVGGVVKAIGERLNAIGPVVDAALGLVGS